MHVGNNMGIMTTLKKPTPERGHGHQRALGRGKMCSVKHAITNVSDFMLAPIVVTVILNQHHVIHDGP
jgi:hypothetical protein